MGKKIFFSSDNSTIVKKLAINKKNNKFVVLTNIGQEEN